MDAIRSRILTVRGVQVMLDRDLAELYGVPTKVLNQAVKRNIERFPERFMFQLNSIELENWKSQIVTSNSNLEQYVKMGVRRAPFAFTEQGVAMLSAVLKSNTAVIVSIRIMDAFVAMRKAQGTSINRSASCEDRGDRQAADSRPGEERHQPGAQRGAVQADTGCDARQEVPAAEGLLRRADIRCLRTDEEVRAHGEERACHHRPVFRRLRPSARRTEAAGRVGPCGEEFPEQAAPCR